MMADVTQKPAEHFRGVISKIFALRSHDVSDQVVGFLKAIGLDTEATDWLAKCYCLLHGDDIPDDPVPESEVERLFLIT